MGVSSMHCTVRLCCPWETVTIPESIRVTELFGDAEWSGVSRKVEVNPVKSGFVSGPMSQNPPRGSFEDGFRSATLTTTK
jgi:hypothetical protein